MRTSAMRGGSVDDLTSQATTGVLLVVASTTKAAV
jgi:hypothetical protein